MSSSNVFLMTSQVCILFAQHMAEATFDSSIWSRFYCLLSREVIFYFIKNSVNEPVWVININDEYSFSIVNVINTTFWRIVVEQQIGVIFIRVMAKHLVIVSMTGPMECSSEIHSFYKHQAYKRS